MITFNKTWLCVHNPNPTFSLQFISQLHTHTLYILSSFFPSKIWGSVYICMLPFLLSSSLPCLYCMPKPCFLIPQAKQKPWKYRADTMEIHQCTSAIAVPTLSQAVSLQLPCMEVPHRLISNHIEQTGSYDDTACEAVKQKWKKENNQIYNLKAWLESLVYPSKSKKCKSVELDHFTLYTCTL